jgi:hypothetical protein
MPDQTDYDPDEFGCITPTLAESDDEETVMADHSGGDPADWVGDYAKERRP